MIHLRDPVETIRGIGPELAGKLTRAGLVTVRDLICCLPSRYEDWNQPTLIRSLRPGKERLIRATVRSIGAETLSRRGQRLMTALIEDVSGAIEAVWFHGSYLMKLLHKDSTWLFRGVVTRYRSGRLQMIHPTVRSTGGLIPIYPQIQGIRTRTVERLIRSALADLNTVGSPISDEDLKRRQFVTPEIALTDIHHPTDLVAVGRAHRSLAFVELVRFATKIERLLANRQTLAAPPFSDPEPNLETFRTHLPFELTPDQVGAVDAILENLRQAHPMRFLLQGDVGTGKTIVAAAVSFWMIKRGLGVVWLVPTDILARQHAADLSAVLAPLGIRVGRWTRHAKTDQSESLVVGTHALLHRQKRDFLKIGLIVIDEQHRFGVKERQVIEELAHRPAWSPHLLMMSATPIPRTLASHLFGLNQSSTIRTRPAGRQPTATTLVESETSERAMWTDLGACLMNQEQVYVVVPMIDRRATDGSTPDKGIQDRCRAIKERFPRVNMAILHGQLPVAERHRIMRDFERGQIALIVATTVIEVGVNVPNATRMVIFDSQYFGLAQLHQLRGRVGRGDKPGRCYLLFPGDETDDTQQERLHELANETDGLKLAEYDLARRGPGDVFGAAQSGRPIFRFGNFMDMKLFEEAKTYVKRTTTRRG